MNQIEAQYQEILYILDKLLANLGLVLEDYDAEYLTQADLYIEIFKIMFPALEHALNADFGEDVTDEDIIQYLVNILAKDIIRMDLGHIRGELIAQGDAKSILNFLQLLLEISNMIEAEKTPDKGAKKKSKDNKKLVKSSGNSIEHSSEKSSMEVAPKYHSAQGIEAEFSNSLLEEESNAEEQKSEQEFYEEENKNAYYNEAMKNKALYEQQQAGLRVNKTEPRNDSRSVSRISEVSKSKESSEYDKGTKKMSQKFDDFNPVQKRGDSGKQGSKQSSKHGSQSHSSSGNAKQIRAENLQREQEEQEEQEEEEQGEDELEEYQEEEEQEQEGDEYGLQHDPGYTEESQQEHEGEENLYMQEEEYLPGTGEDEIVEEGEEELYQRYQQEGRKESKEEGETEDVEYYADDPINYPPMGKGNWRHAYEAEKEAVVRSRNSSDAKVNKHNVQEQEEEYYGQEGEYEEQMEQGEQEERGQMYEQYEHGEYEEEEREAAPEVQEEINYGEPMDQVVEEQDEENYEEDRDRYGNKRSQARYEQEYANQGAVAVKAKGKTKAKGKAGGKKKKVAKEVDDYGSKKIQQRALKPPTAGMKVKREKRSETKKSTARKSDESDSTQRSKKLVHSKSERNLNVAEDQEHSQEYSEDRGLQPKEYYQEEGNQEEEGQGQGGYQQEGEEGNQEGYELQEEFGQIPDGNVFKILSDNVMRVKENLRENRAIEDIPFDDERTAMIIMQQKNQYKQYLRDFMKDHQLREKKYETMRQLGQKNFVKKVRSEKAKDDNMRKDFENQQKSLYFKMRDEKVNYLRRVHKTIFELEKKRIIEDKREYIEFRTTRNKEAQNMIDSIKNEYKNKLSTLRERNANQQHERKVANEAQRAFIQAFEKELKAEQMKEVERIKNKWRYEKEKFDMMIKDEGFLERKIMELYKKGHY